MQSFEYRRKDEREAPAAPRASEPQRAFDPAERLASTVGNSAFGAFVARQGAGILPDGRAHPDVEATIAQTRGSGATLDGAVRDRVGGPLGDSLADVRVHTDSTADALARSVSARAFTTGSDVYFARGEYSPGTGAGDRLLAHELTHVVQQRGAPVSGPLQVSQPGDALEAEADAATGELLG